MLHKLLLLASISQLLAQSDPRIFNGNVAIKGQFPWQAALFIPTNWGLRFCGGALISDSWVLTSAQCLFGAMFQIRVVLGTTKSDGTDPDQVEIHSNEWVYLQYDPYFFEGDIGLVKLSEAVTSTAYIRPIALGYEDLAVGTDVTVSGWGQISDGGPRVADLTYSNLFTGSTDECTSYFVTPSTLCVSPDPQSEAQNVCVGDTGSGLVANATTDEPVHVGIVSWYGGCRSNQTAGFVRTGYYRYWIFTQTGL